MASGDPEKGELGEKIILVGLWVQIVAFVFFLLVAIVFHLRQRKAERSSYNKHNRAAGGWRKMLYALYAASALVLARNFFRVIEYAQGNDGYLMSNEVWLYLFDATLMWVLMVLFNVVHPGRALADVREVVARRETDEIELVGGQRWNRVP